MIRVLVQFFLECFCFREFQWFRKWCAVSRGGGTWTRFLVHRTEYGGHGHVGYSEHYVWMPDASKPDPEDDYWGLKVEVYAKPLPQARAL